MIFASKLRWNYWRVRHILYWISQVSLRAARAVHRRTWRIAYGRVWLGMAGVLLLLSLLLTLPRTGADMPPYLSYEQIGALRPQVSDEIAIRAPILPQTSGCSILYQYLNRCEP